MTMTLSIDGAPWPRIPVLSPLLTVEASRKGCCTRPSPELAWKPAVLCDYRDDRHQRAARRALVLGAAGDVEHCVADDAGQDAAHQRAGMARRLGVVVVQHGVTPAAVFTGRRCFGLGEDGHDLAAQATEHAPRGVGVDG